MAYWQVSKRSWKNGIFILNRVSLVHKFSQHTLKLVDVYWSELLKIFRIGDWCFSVIVTFKRHTALSTYNHRSITHYSNGFFVRTNAYLSGVPRTYDFRFPWLSYRQFPFSDPLEYDISVSSLFFCPKSFENMLYFSFPPWK